MSTVPSVVVTRSERVTRRARSEASFDHSDLVERDDERVSLRVESEAAATERESPRPGNVWGSGATHAQYAPAVTNPIRCLDLGGGNAQELRMVPTERVSKGTREFYADQNHAVESFCAMDKLRREVRQEIHDDGGSESEDTPAKVAIRGSFFVNVIILAAKVVLVIRTGSVAFVASLLDSVLDLASGGTLMLMNKLVGKQDFVAYPLGKSTFEPLGTLVFACCMFTASFQLLQHAAEVLMRDSHDVVVDLSSMIFIACIVLSKFGLMIYCRKYQAGRPSVAALAADHRNDVASNLVGVVGAVLAERYYWRIDPILAVLITFYIMYVWAGTGKEQLETLSGKTAPKDIIRQLTYAAQHHHPAILFVDTVRAVSLGGDGYFVEVDIVLPPETPLRESHDIGESLQMVLEKLESVSRAYVHIDYEFAHRPSEHR